MNRQGEKEASESCSDDDNRSTSSSSSDDDYQGIEDGQDEELDEELNIKVRGLFCDNEFNNIRDMFKHELEHSNFNLINLVKHYDMSMIDYIKMKPTVDVFHLNYQNPNELPWSDDKYMKSCQDEDPALQFDVEEDLDLIDFGSEINNNSSLKNEKLAVEVESVKVLKNKLKESESKIEELVEMVDKLRNLASDLLNKTNTSNGHAKADEKVDGKTDDSHYVNSYSNYSIHSEMLQDEVRTLGYMNAIMDNAALFKDKVVLDVGCGSGILSLFAAKAGAKLVIAVDMSDIIDKAIEIAKENDYEKKIVFLKGKMEEVKLPVDSVDIIISEWMGYFLLYESMLDSVLYARDRYLTKINGIILPNFFEMQLFGVSDDENYEKTYNFWSNVYGFKMNVMKKTVAEDAQVTTIAKEFVVTNMFTFKTIDCLSVRKDDVAKFEVEFTLTANKETMLTGIGASFETYFNQSQLDKKSSFSTSPFNKTTHWEQTFFQFEEKISVTKDTKIKGKIECFKNPDYERSYVVLIKLNNQIFKYIID